MHERCFQTAFNFHEVPTHRHCSAFALHLSCSVNRTTCSALPPKQQVGTSFVLSILQEKQKELAAAPRKIISYLKPNMTVAVVDDFQVYGAKAIPAQVRTGLGCTCLLRLVPG